MKKVKSESGLFDEKCAFCAIFHKFGIVIAGIRKRDKENGQIFM